MTETVIPLFSLFKLFNPDQFGFFGSLLGTRGWGATEHLAAMLLQGYGNLWNDYKISSAQILSNVPKSTN